MVTASSSNTKQNSVITKKKMRFMVAIEKPAFLSIVIYRIKYYFVFQIMIYYIILLSFCFIDSNWSPRMHSRRICSLPLLTGSEKIDTIIAKEIQNLLLQLNIGKLIEK